MKNLFKKLEDVYAAAAFAETGEFETARELLREKKSADKQLRKRMDKEKRSRISAN